MKPEKKTPVKCPACRMLLLHKIELRVKCPHCCSIVDVDLATETGECVSVPIIGAVSC